MFDQIDSAKRATDASERAIDDARAKQALLDSLARAREGAIADTVHHIRRSLPNER